MAQESSDDAFRWACSTDTLLPDDVPRSNLFFQDGKPPQLAMTLGTFWPIGKKLRVRFLPGTSRYVQGKVMFYAKKWEEFANIDLRFVGSGDAEIRISFDKTGKRSWSQVGTHCLSVPADQATMNFGWFDDNTRDEEFSRTTVHEFGHALGCVHEHQSPTVSLDWDRPKVYQYFKDTNGWDQAMVDSNIFAKYTAQQAISTPFDSKSIMLYFFPNNLFKDSRGTSTNVELSALDKQFINRVYPFQSRSAGIADTREQRPWYPPISLNTKQFMFIPPYREPPRIAVGLTSLDMDQSKNRRISVTASRITSDNFVLSMNAWADTLLYSAASTWVEFEQSDQDYQFGTWTCSGLSSRANTTRVSFSQQYSSPPKIVVWLSGLDFGHDKNLRISAYPSNVNASSFDLHLDTWADSIMYSATATWIAYPAGKQGVSSGSDTSSKYRPWFPASLKNGAAASFDNDMYDKPPRVFVAVNKLDFDAGRNLRFEAKATEVTERGFQWNVDSWADTLCYEAGVSWIAFD